MMKERRETRCTWHLKYRHLPTQALIKDSKLSSRIYPRHHSFWFWIETNVFVSISFLMSPIVISVTLTSPISTVPHPERVVNDETTFTAVMTNKYSFAYGTVRFLNVKSIVVFKPNFVEQLQTKSPQDHGQYWCQDGCRHTKFASRTNQLPV